MNTKKLSDVAFHSISKCRRPDFLLYHDSQPMESAFVFSDKKDEASRGNPPAKLHNCSEILRLTDSLPFCKPERTLCDGPTNHLSAERISAPSS